MRRRAFTLVEILAVIGIIVILMGMVLVVTKRAQVASRDAVTKNTFKAILSAVEQYRMHFGTAPPDQYTAGKEPVEVGTGDDTESSAVLLWYLEGRPDSTGGIVLPDGTRVKALLDLSAEFVKEASTGAEYLVDARGNPIRYDRDGGTDKPLLVSGSGDSEVRSEEE